MRRALLSIAIVVGIAPPTATADERQTCITGTRYRGHKIDVDFKEAGLHDVFRFLSDVGRVNVVVADDVVGKVTMRLRKVPWDQALCVVAQTKRLHVTLDGNVYMIRSRTPQ
jgi:type II secretory pathway component HofQ